ncbi:Sigma-54-binding protein, partial [Pseudomonas syringae pv. maculicola]
PAAALAIAAWLLTLYLTRTSSLAALIATPLTLIERQAKLLVSSGDREQLSALRQLLESVTSQLEQSPA